MMEIWERQIRLARVILSALMKQHCTSLTDESLVMLLMEFGFMINSSPLTVETISDMGNETPLSLNNLLKCSFASSWYIFTY